MAKTDAQNWDNYWQGRASKATGNALIEVGIENNHDLNHFWLEQLKSKPKTTQIVDLACGAGSVLKHALNLKFPNLTGVDISKGALQALTDNISYASTICAPVNNTGLKDEAYDLAVSQYGIEYAGDRKALLQTFMEMHRILKADGEIIVVAHIKDGVIYEGCMDSLKQIQLIKDSQFIPVARDILLTLYKEQSQARDAQLQKLMERLNQSASPVSNWLRGLDRTTNEFARFTYHLLESSHKLITNHTAYSKADSLNWLEGINAELSAYKGRMDSMTRAALSEDDLTFITESLTLENTRLRFEDHEKIFFASKKKPAAWVIKAIKHA